MTQTHITVRRPNGQIEIVIKDGVVPEQIRPQMVKATRDGGRGEIIGWQVVIIHISEPTRPY